MQWFVGKCPKHIQIGISKYAKKFFRKHIQKIPILIAIFQRPVIKPSAIEMRGPDTFGRFDVVCQPKIDKIGKNFYIYYKFHVSEAKRHPQLHGVRQNTLFCRKK